jgi:hypothetical protein
MSRRDVSIGGALFVLATVAAGCGNGATPPPAAAPTSASGGRTPAEICAGTTYSRCVGSVTTALGAGWRLFVICEYAGGEGDVALIDKAADAPDECSGSGLITPSKVFAVVDLR